MSHAALTGPAAEGHGLSDGDDLERAHAASAGVDATDDAGLVEALGVAVHVVAGHPEAFKVTRPLDLLLAEAVVRAREVPA